MIIKKIQIILPLATDQSIKVDLFYVKHSLTVLYVRITTNIQYTHTHTYEVVWLARPASKKGREGGLVVLVIM